MPAPFLTSSKPERSNSNSWWTSTHAVGELHNLLAVTKTLEDKDMDGALNELEVRKDELTQKAQDIMMMGEDAPAEETKTEKKEEKTEEKTDAPVEKT